MFSPADLLTDVPTSWVLVVAGALIVAEVGTLVGVVLPGVTAVLALGYLGRSGAVDPIAAVVVAISCEIVGGHLAYTQGRRTRSERSAGPFRRHIAPLVDRFGRTRSWARAMEVRALGILERRGVVAILLCQWVAGVRTLTPRLVGSAGMSYRTFAVAQIPSAAMWVWTWMTIGAAVGAAYERIASGVTVIGLVVLTAGLLAAAIWSITARRRISPNATRDVR
ncbi:hypothetical protein B2J88_47360 [Rhodococcus sp. SRB_17]|nr:hypothetical protein [Rhodococcus sp. SRB_17]